MPNVLSGSWVALITPFKKGAIDWKSLESLVDWHIDSGTDGLVLCGTTAETPTLTEEEQWDILKTISARAKGKIGLMAGCGSNSTAKTIASVKKADSLNLDALLVVTPYYNKPTQKGLKEHFAAVAKNVRTPIVIYNVPSRTGVNMLPETVVEAARASARIAAVKEASGNVDQASLICREAPKGFSVLSGDDSLTLPMMAAGAKGVISVAANAAPKETAAMTGAWLKGEAALAQKWHLQLMPLFRALFLETNPAPVKFALWKMGKIASPELRLPLVETSADTQAKLSSVLSGLGLMKKKVKA